MNETRLHFPFQNLPDISFVKSIAGGKWWYNTLLVHYTCGLESNQPDMPWWLKGACVMAAACEPPMPARQHPCMVLCCHHIYLVPTLHAYTYATVHHPAPWLRRPSSKSFSVHLLPTTPSWWCGGA